MQCKFTTQLRNFLFHSPSLKEYSAEYLSDTAVYFLSCVLFIEATFVPNYYLR